MSPDATIVHADDGHIKLTATFPTSCSLETFVDEEGVTRCYASLFMSDGQYNYRIFSDGDEEDYKEHFYPTYIKEDDAIRVTFDLDLSNESLCGVYRTIAPYNGTNSSYSYTLKLKYFKINDISKGKIYRWKIRVYEKNSILSPAKYISKTNMGYGTISDIKSASNKSEPCVSLTTFAHTNIYDWIIGEVPRNGSKTSPEITYVANSTWEWYNMDEDYNLPEDCAYNILKYIYSITDNIDENIEYYIKINGVQYHIEKYRHKPFFFSSGSNILLSKEQNGSEKVYLPQGWVDSIESPSNRIHNDHGIYGDTYDTEEDFFNVVKSCVDNGFDSYGNPTSGYILVNTNGVVPCEEGDTYTIACNYIDSDEGYFEIYSKPTVSLIEENVGIQFTDTDSNIVIGTEANPYTLAYCNVDISAAVSQAEGVEHEYYYYKIYEYSDRGKYEIIHHSGNIYNSDIRVTYDDFLDNRKYKLVISIVDVNQQTIERELYFKTEFPYLGDNSMVKAEYYRDHNSVVVEWSLGNSITPTIKNNNYEYVSLNNSEESDAVVLGEDNVVTYTQNDFGQKLNFENSTFALKFKLGTNAGNVAEAHTKDGYFKIYSERDVDSTCDNRIVVETRNGCYYSEIKRIASLEETIEALSTGVSPANRTLQWNNELVWNDDYIWVNGQDTNADEYLVVVNSNDRVRIINLTIGEEFEVLKRDGSGDFISESMIILYGDTTFTDMALINDSDISVMDNLVNNEWLWTEGTQAMCSFNDTLNGAMDVTTSNSKLIGYKIYKTIGDGIKLYKIDDIDNPNYNVIEDFVVGDNCKYQYYLFPIYQD